MRTITKTCAIFLFVLGCTDNTKDLGNVHLIAQELGAEKGGALAVTEQHCLDDAAACPFVGTSIVIPRGALKQNTEIAISVGASASNIDGTHAGPAIDFAPDGTVFNTPVEITIPVTADIDVDRLRVYITEADGTRTVKLPNEIAYDPQRRTARFLVDHFTTFQCGQANDACSDVVCPANVACQDGQCGGDCTPNECGPAPGIPSWTCEDGSIGGSTGECRRNADGTCGWVINNCPRACDPSECGPAPGAPAYQCPDGSTAGPVCERLDNGGCGWSFRECPVEDCANVDCGPNHVCDPNTGSCQPTNTPCGSNVCGAGEYCCNESCGTCAPLDGSCTQEWCGGNCADTGVDTCPPNTVCDPSTGDCVPSGTQCGPSFCGANEVCCNESCGICVQPGESCIEPACNDCSLVSCANGYTCVPTPAGPVCEPQPCTDAECGPQPGVPSWTCEDGSPGGSTGNCLRNSDGTCGWEIIWCEMACDANACGNQPPPNGNDACQDGTVPPYRCVSENGQCTWVQDGC